MPSVNGPIHVRATIPNSTEVFTATLQLVNTINTQGIRIYNKGPFDVKYHGAGIIGEDWIPAGTSKAYNTTKINTKGILTFTAFATESNNDSQFYDTAMYSIVLVTQYQIDEHFDEMFYVFPIIGPTPDIIAIDNPACQGTTITLPFSTGTNAPYSNNKFCALIGFTLTGSVATAVRNGNLVINNLNNNNANTGTLTYLIQSSVSVPFILRERYEENGLMNLTQTHIQIVVPTVSDMIINLCVFCTFNPRSFI